MDEELKAALEFSKAMLRTTGQLDPMVVGIKPPSGRGMPDHVMMAPRGVQDRDDKYVAFSVMAVAARFWGAQRIVFVSDSWMVKGSGDKVYDPEVEGYPSEHPDRTEAIIASVFDLDAGTTGFILPYVRGGEAIAFGEIEPLPEEGEQMGMIPFIMHKALAMTDEQLREMFAGLSALSGDETPTDAEGMFRMMRANGYAVLQA